MASNRPPPGFALPQAPNTGFYQFPFQNSTNNWRSSPTSMPNFDQVFPINFARAPFPFSIPVPNGSYGRGHGHGPPGFSYANFRHPSPSPSPPPGLPYNNCNGFPSTIPSYPHNPNFEHELSEFSFQELLRRFPVSANYQQQQQKKDQDRMKHEEQRQKQAQERKQQEWLEQQEKSKQKEEEAELYPFLAKLASYIVSTPQAMDHWMKMQSEQGFLKPLPKDPLMFWTLSDKSVLDEFATLRPEDYKNTVHMDWPGKDLQDVDALLQQAGPEADAPLPPNSEYPKGERQQTSSGCSGEESSLTPQPMSSTSSGSRQDTSLDSPRGSSDTALPESPEDCDDEEDDDEPAWSPRRLDRLVNAKTAAGMASLAERFNGMSIPEGPPPDSYIYQSPEGKTVFVQNPINHRYYPLSPIHTSTPSPTANEQNSRSQGQSPSHSRYTYDGPCMTFGHNHSATECARNDNEDSNEALDATADHPSSTPKRSSCSCSHSGSGSPSLSPKLEANNSNNSSGSGNKEKSASHKFYDAFMAAYAAVKNEGGRGFEDLISLFGHGAHGCDKKLNLNNISPTKQQNAIACLQKSGYFRQESQSSSCDDGDDESAGEGPIIEIRGTKNATFKKLEKKGTKKEFLCVFCLKNDEPEETYKSHPIRVDGIVTCPYLRDHVCALCGASGDTAHTIKYCPFNKRGFYALKAVERTEGPDAALALKIRNDMDESFRRFKFNNTLQGHGHGHCHRQGQGDSRPVAPHGSPRYQYAKTISTPPVNPHPQRVSSAPDNFAPGRSSPASTPASAASGSSGYLRRGKIFNRRRVHSVERERVSTRTRVRIEETGPRHYFGASSNGTPNPTNGSGVGHDNRQRTNGSFNFGKPKFVPYPRKTYRRYLPRPQSPMDD